VLVSRTQSKLQLHLSSIQFGPLEVYTEQTHSQQTDQYSLQRTMAQWQSEENVQEKAAFVSESQEVR